MFLALNQAKNILSEHVRVPMCARMCGPYKNESQYVQTSTTNLKSVKNLNKTKKK